MSLPHGISTKSTMRCLIFLTVLQSFGLSNVTGQSEDVQARHGFRFINHTNSQGIKPQPGDSVLFRSYVWINDSLISGSSRTIRNVVENDGKAFTDTIQYVNGRIFKLFSEDCVPKSHAVWYYSLLLMGEGDSATVFVQIDTLLQEFVPTTLKDAKEIRYELVLVDVLTEEEKEANRAKAIAHFHSIRNKTQDAVKSYAAGMLTGLTTTTSGLKIKIEDYGSGSKITTESIIELRYYVCLTDGTIIDDTYQRDEIYPCSARPDNFIPGL